MQFGNLLGNDQLKARLSAAFSKNQVSHCYLILGPVGSGKRTLALELAAALQCADQRPPCHRCAPCRKVLGGSHPDVIWVDEPDRATIPVEKVRQVRADAFIRPNEGRKKIYIFPQAQKLNPAGQNALLKLIEEPPGYGVFLLLSDSAEGLLPTVRSRCVDLHLTGLEEPVLRAELQRRFPQASSQELHTAVQAADGNLGFAIHLLTAPDGSGQYDEEFAAALASQDPYLLLILLTKLEKLGRDPFCAVMQSWQILLHEAIVCRAKGTFSSADCQRLCQALTARKLLSAYHTIQSAIEACRGNIGIGHLCGALSVQLRREDSLLGENR